MAGTTGTNTDAEARTNTATQQAEGLTPLQLKKIWVLARELGWDSARLHQWVDMEFGWTSIGSLGKDEAIKVIDRMGRLAERKGSGRGGPGGRSGQADRKGAGYRQYQHGVDAQGELVTYCTPAQVAKMYAIANRVGWGDAWIRTVAGRKLERTISSLREIRAAEAATVIGVVEVLVGRRLRERAQTQIGERAEGSKAEGLKGQDGERSEG